jgi:uncharacterized membrane protein YkvA (DUF1232 family)
MITAGIAYFVTPFDLFPQELYGAEGYFDNVYLCLWIIAQLREQIPEHVLAEAWEGEGDILEIVVDELPGLEETVGEEGVKKIRKYLGLST